VLIFVVAIVIEIPLHVVRRIHEVSVTGTATTAYHTSALGSFLVVLIVVAYGGLMCGSERGQTVGMMAVGVRAIRLDTGGPIGYGRAVGRGVLEWILSILVLPWIVDMLFPLWDPKRQTLHDKATGTVVITR